MSEPCLQQGFSRADLVRLLAERGMRRGAEIGVRQGAFALELCRAIPNLELLCIDPWRYYPTNPRQPSQDRQDANYRIAIERLAPYRVRLLRASSMEAVAEVPPATLDFVYIDGNHGYEYVREDLQAWSPRVRFEGIVSGDDYDAPGVRRALHEYVTRHGIVDWNVIDERRRRNRKGQVFRSWWWVQAAA